MSSAEWLLAFALIVGAAVPLFGILRMLLVPFAIAFEFDDRRRRKRRHSRWQLLEAERERRAKRLHTDRDELVDARPRVTVVVPGYNESKVIDNCVRSIVNCGYPNLEVLLVDDGSSDDTFARMQRLEAEHEVVRAFTQANGGKGAALNNGIRRASGEVLILVDADGLFLPDTIDELLAGFDDPRVGAVCGDDRPVNLDRVQTKFMALISHVGTGLMRRALHLLRCMPVVSGNSGAFRRSALEDVGLLREDTIGEDLELTWRLHRAGYRVSFAPRALVYAESPSTLRGLWKQRVRWARGLLHGYRIHAGAVGNPRYGSFGVFLLVNFAMSVVLPVVQLVLLAIALVLLAMGVGALVPLGVWQAVLWLGYPVSLLLIVIAVALNRALGDLKHLWALPLWPLYSVWMNMVMVKAIWLELRGAPQRWNKLERTGVVSVEAARSSASMDAEVTQ